MIESVTTTMRVPSRAEITDAALAHRAECVMLNKGPHIMAASGCLTTSSGECWPTGARKAP